MSLSKIMAGGIAGVVLAMSAGAAFAYPADATGNVNVRSGPGVAFPVVASLSAGEPVNVGQCRLSWCHVTDGGRAGWVAAAFLNQGRAAAAYAPVYYPDYYAPDYFDYGFGSGNYGNHNFGFGHGDGFRGHRGFGGHRGFSGHMGFGGRMGMNGGRMGSISGNSGLINPGGHGSGRDRRG